MFASVPPDSIGRDDDEYAEHTQRNQKRSKIEGGEVKHWSYGVWELWSVGVMELFLCFLSSVFCLLSSVFCLPSDPPKDGFAVANLPPPPPDPTSAEPSARFDGADLPAFV